MATIVKKSKYPYALAVYNGIIKKIYEIFDWVLASTQLYFTRALD